MRIIFMGTPQFSAPTLEAILAAGHEVVGVVTQPDRPARHGLAAAPPPVKVPAVARGLLAGPWHRPAFSRGPEWPGKCYNTPVVGALGVDP